MAPEYKADAYARTGAARTDTIADPAAGVGLGRDLISIAGGEESDDTTNAWYLSPDVSFAMVAKLEACRCLKVKLCDSIAPQFSGMSGNDKPYVKHTR